MSDRGTRCANAVLTAYRAARPQVGWDHSICSQNLCGCKRREGYMRTHARTVDCVHRPSRATPERPAGEAEPSGLDAENRELAARFWVHYRCGYVGCQTVEQHEHGGGPPMRAMTPDERIAARLTPERPAEEAGG